MTMTWWRRVQRRWRAMPTRTRVGVLIAVIALAGLMWQHSTAKAPAPAPAAEAHNHSHDEDDLTGHAVGEYQLPDPDEEATLRCRQRPGLQCGMTVDLTLPAARDTAQRFASNFASPNGNRDDWLARVSADVTPGLAAQYRLTDIRNVPQATVTEVNGPTDQMPGAMTFEATYNDGTKLALVVAMAGDSWKVDSVVPIPSPAAPTIGRPPAVVSGADMPAAASPPPGQGR